MKNLRNKVAVITGAGSGIGRALAIALAAEGTRLALSDINAESLAETARQAGFRTPAMAFGADFILQFEGVTRHDL